MSSITRPVRSVQRIQGAPEADYAKLPPQAPELEQSVLGAVLLDGSCMAEVADVLTDAVFYVPANALVWKAMANMYAVRAPIDILTVTQWLTRQGNLQAVGGAFYISKLTNTVGGTANLHYHARILVQYHLKRESIRIGSELMKAGYDGTEDPFSSLESAQSEIRVLNEFGGCEDVTMSSMMPQVVDGPYVDTGVPFGFVDLDQKIRAEPGTVTIVAARPGMGKTSFMLSSAWRQATLNYRPYIVELEMKSQNLARRLVCGECGIPVELLKRNKLTTADHERMAVWSVKPENATCMDRMFINPSASMTTSVLAARIDRARRKENIDVVWVDYMGLLQPSERQKDAYHRMTKISNELRVMAKEMNLPFIVLAQLSRPPKGSTIHRPSLTDLRDSGEIEQDCEAALFLHRPDYYMDRSHPDYQPDNTFETIIGKHRDGDLTTVPLSFQATLARVVDRMHFTDNTLPPYMSEAVIEDEKPF